MSFALEPPDLKNTIKSTFSPSFDSFFILYDIQDNSVNQKSEEIVLNLNKNEDSGLLWRHHFWKMTVKHS